MKVTAFLFLIILNLYSYVSYSASSCSLYLERNSVDNSQELESAVRSLLADVSRNKANLFSRFYITRCRIKNCVEIKSQSGIKFIIKIDPKIKSSTISLSQNSKTLIVPSLKSTSLQSNRNLFRKFLVGHELHPYTPGGKFRYKPSQAVALRAFVEFLKSGQKSFLHVAPTSMGKGLNLALAYQARLTFPNLSKLSIFTADRIKVVEQIAETLRSRNLQGSPEIIVWNETSNITPLELIKIVQDSQKPIALVITTQSLKPLLTSLDGNAYKDLSSLLDGLYIDEAHHYGAPETFQVLNQLLNSSSGFLYGSTATPVHQRVNLKDFFDVQHWSYLNEKGNLFQEHSVDKGLAQLRIGIDRGEINPFDDLYIIGEPNFTTTPQSPLFINGDSARYVLNPEHYLRLSQLLYPIISANKKGFIVAATISEAKRMSQFLSEAYPSVTFEPYHSLLTSDERNQVLMRSQSLNRHYMIAVKSLDEGVNIPYLSAYIDLNSSVSVKQMIHRIGRVLRLNTGKISSDILFLSDLKNEEMAKDLLLIMDIINENSFDSNSRRTFSGDIDFINLKFQGLARQDLLAARGILEEAARRFWYAKGFQWMTFVEAKKYARSLKLKTVSEFKKWIQSKERPINFPKVPSNMYQNDGWTGIRDFLGIRIKWMTFAEAQVFILTQGLKTQKEFAAWAKSDRRPPNFPTNPQIYYKDSGWTTFTEFLNTGRGVKGQYLSFDQAVKFLKPLRLTGRREYHKWISYSPNRPLGLPYGASLIYKDQGWISWQHYLGNDFMGFQEARTLVRTMNFRTAAELREWLRSGNGPDNFPGDPAKVYKNDGWAGYGDFLGTGRIANQNRVWMSYEDARKLIQSEGIRTSAEFETWKKSGRRPDNFPASPETAYKNSGWTGYRNFLN